jgi:hypothetical protein
LTIKHATRNITPVAILVRFSYSCFSFQIDEANLREGESMDDEENEYTKQESEDNEAKDKEETKSGAGNY